MSNDIQLATMDVHYFDEEYYYNTTDETLDDDVATCLHTTTSKNTCLAANKVVPDDEPSHRVNDSKNALATIEATREITSECNSYASSDDSTGSEYIYHPPPPLPSKRVDSMKDVRVIMDEDEGDDDENIVEECDRDEQNRPLLLKLRKRRPKAKSTQQPSDLPPMFEMYRQRYLLKKQREEQQEEQEINETLMMTQMTLKEDRDDTESCNNNSTHYCSDEDDNDEEDPCRPMTSVYLKQGDEKVKHHGDDNSREYHQYYRPGTMETIETREQESAPRGVEDATNATHHKRSSLMSDSSLLDNSVDDANTYIQQKVQQRWYDSTSLQFLNELDFEDVDNNNDDESCTTCYDNEVDDEDSETGHVQDACDGSIACRRSSRRIRPSSSSMATTTHPFRARTPLAVLSSIAETATTTAMANHDVGDMGGVTTAGAFSNETHPFRSSTSSTASSIRFNCDSHCNNHHQHHHDHSDARPSLTGGAYAQEDQGQRHRDSIIEIADPTMMWKATTTTTSTTAATAANNRHHQRRNVLNRHYEGFWTTEWDNEAKAWYYYNSFTGEATWFDPRQE